MVMVYTWPPVGVIASKWTIRRPLASSRSMITGAEYTSAMLRERIVASRRVGGWSFDYTGHGYMEALKDFLDGGANLVRLDEIIEPSMLSQSRQWGAWPNKLEWRDANYQVFTWRRANGQVITWTPGQLYTAQMTGPRTIIVYGLPPNTIILRPSNRVLAVKMPDGPHFRAFSTRRVVSDANGAAVIRLNTDPGAGVTHAVMRFRESAIFRVEGKLPEVDTVVNEEPIWDWKFIQVYEDEVQGGFTEEDPW